MKDYRTLIFHDNLTLIIDFKSKSCSPNQLARRTAATLPPRRTAVLFCHGCPKRAAQPSRRAAVYTAAIGRHAAGENVKQCYSPAGGGARFGGLPAKAGRGQTPSTMNARKTAARTADEGPFGVVAERYPQPEAHKAGAIVRRVAREHGKRAGL
ncbi:hypothetical protein [Bacteroides fragilis]|uniref:hypothetical protein n=1 Tax=Bacteroides fragilis TaxID=817 RepID=UPI0012D2A892|nr:hypothetical protein [Bacteroides fragilis]